VSLESAVWTVLNDDFGRLVVEGAVEPPEKLKVTIINYTVSGDALMATWTRVTTTGGETTATYKATKNFAVTDAPCMVQAVVETEDGTVYSSPLAVDYPEGSPVDCSGVDLTNYPGGTYNVFFSTVGNKTLVAWPSRFCQQGQPTYSYAWDGDDEGLTEDQLAKRDALVTLFNETSSFSLLEDLYLTDLFGVAGSQRSIDFATEGYPQAGEVPFGCVWTARGVLLPGDDPRTEEVEEASHMVWTKPERLTSGRRDPNRIEVAGVAGAGFVMTWQEDPDGLRPGQGEGPGEGWSGAVAHDKTDIWYSFIPWEYFDLVEAYDEEGNPAPTVPVNVAEFDLLDSGRPQVFVPMATPMRLSNNDKCVPDFYAPGVSLDPTDPKYFSYCNFEVAAAYGLQDFCVDTVTIPQGQTGAEGEICVNEDGLPNVANTGSTRPRTSLQGRDENDDGVYEGAWVIVAAEESKGLGRYTFLPDGTPCDELPPDDPDYNPDCQADIGKNQWYFSFDMGAPDSSATADKEFGLVQNLVNQGDMLNQPEVDWRTGELYPVINTLDMWDFELYNFDLYNTEIARRSSLLVQSVEKACASSSGLVAISSWKQGAMRQGGPADVMFRRFVAPCAVEPQGVCDSDNPGPGPGGVQPTIDTATWDVDSCHEVEVIDDEGVTQTITVCTLLVEGTVCVDGFEDPTDIVLDIHNATTDDVLCYAKVDEDYSFSTDYSVTEAPGEAPVHYECILPIEEEPCSVTAVTGPGLVPGKAQKSDPVDVEGVSLETCVGEPVPDEQ
jgi:hypothetical protein